MTMPFLIFHAAAIPWMNPHLMGAILAGFHPVASLTSTILKFLEQALIDYGYIIVFSAIMIESMGVPFPGETMLLIASAYAASSGTLSIFGVIACAAGGAMTGDSLGYWIGREGGRRLIRRYGKFVGLTIRDTNAYRATSNAMVVKLYFSDDSSLSHEHGSPY